MKFFVLATDTDAGKTVFSYLFIKKFFPSHGYRYWKFLQTGTSESDDTSFLKSRLGEEVIESEPIFQWKISSAPHFASKKENHNADPELILKRLQESPSRNLLIEGVGGVMVPVNEDKLLIDLVASVRFPVLLIVKTSLGTINHSLLSLDILNKYGIKVIGFYGMGKIGELELDNMHTIEKFSGIKNLGYCDYQSILNHESKFESGFDHLGLLETII